MARFPRRVEQRVTPISKERRRVRTGKKLDQLVDLLNKRDDLNQSDSARASHPIPAHRTNPDGAGFGQASTRKNEARLKPRAGGDTGCKRERDYRFVKSRAVEGRRAWRDGM